MKTEEERLVEMISEVEAKQNELEELKAYRQRLQGMAIESINRTPRLSSPSYSKYSSRKNSAVSQSPSYYSNRSGNENKTEKKEDRLARIERMLVQVLNHQARNDQEIANLADRIERSQISHQTSLQVHQDLNSSFQLSETEPENEVKILPGISTGIFIWVIFWDNYNLMNLSLKIMMSTKLEWSTFKPAVEVPISF